MSFASIIVVAHNRLQDLTMPMLQRLESATVYPHELILIDSGSNDGTYDYFRSISQKAYRQPNNLDGIAAARNIGLKNAEGSTIVYLDNDIFVPGNWLTRLIYDMERGRCGIIGGIPSDELGRLDLPRAGDGLIDVPYLGGGFSAMPRSTFNLLGYKDKGLKFCGEDTDYCLRARLAGLRLASDPWVIAEHRAGATRNALPESLIQESQAAFTKKWWPYRQLFPEIWRRKQ
jgi:GT2 family glycosyltransferase